MHFFNSFFLCRMVNFFIQNSSFHVSRNRFCSCLILINTEFYWCIKLSPVNINRALQLLVYGHKKNTPILLEGAFLNQKISVKIKLYVPRLIFFFRLKIINQHFLSCEIKSWISSANLNCFPGIWEMVHFLKFSTISPFTCQSIQLGITLF